MDNSIRREEKKVEYLELIYDLIFVYIIGRNNSLLAHGYVPIDSDKYQKLLAAALEFARTKYDHIRMDTHQDNAPMRHLLEKS